jgi:hypothetical protein
MIRIWSGSGRQSTVFPWECATHSCDTETTATLTRHVTSVASFFVASVGLPRISLVSAGFVGFVVGANCSSSHRFPLVAGEANPMRH